MNFSGLNTQQFARWSAMIGSIALLIALVIFLSEGELVGIGFAVLVIGVVGVGAWLLFAPDELRAWLTGRQVYYGTGNLLLSVLVIGFVITGYSLVEGRNIAVDLTSAEIFTISQSSIEAIQRLESNLQGTGLRTQIVGFYGREDLREQQSAEFVLRQFEEESNGFLTLRFVDPDLQPLVARQYGFGSAVTTGRLFLEILNVDGNRVTLEPIGGEDERSIASAVLRVSVAGQFKIYFIKGHLEYDVNSQTDFGLSAIYSNLPPVGIQVAELDLTEAQAVPDDASAIVLPGPRSPIPQDHIEKIAAYIGQGGRMLVLGDPPYVDYNPSLSIQNNTFALNESAFNQYLWTEFGVRFTETAIADDGASVFNTAFAFVASRPSVDSQVLSDFGDVPIVLDLVRGIEVIEQVSPQTESGTNQANYRREIILFSSPESFAETSLQDVQADDLAQFDEGVDPEGPVIVAVAVRSVNELNQGQENQPRVIVIGDSDWLTNGYIAPADGSEGVLGNIRLWSNIVEWLTQYSEIATIDAVSRPDLLPLVMTDQQQTRIQLGTLILLPGLVLATGLFVWGYRRRN